MAIMFLLVSGASGAGKSTARRLVADELEPEVECVELHDVVPMPRVPTLAWRQRATEAVVCHALELQHKQGRHLLLAGDPVAAGEVLAAPSADRLDGIAVCLLDVDRDAQASRLAVRGDDPALLVHRVAFVGLDARACDRPTSSAAGAADRRLEADAMQPVRRDRHLGDARAQHFELDRRCGGVRARRLVPSCAGRPGSDDARPVLSTAE
jgi:hypothetical protein